MRRLLRMLCAISAISAVGGEATSRADQLAFTDWQATTPFDGPRTSHAPVPVNNRIYILGGLYASGNSFTLYNDVQTALLGNDGSIAKGSWTKTRPFAEPRSGMGVALYRGSSMWSGDSPTTERLPTFSTPASCRTACLVHGQRAPIDW